MKSTTGWQWLWFLLLLGCSKPEEKPRRTEPWLASASASATASPGALPLRYEVLAESRVRFTLPGRRAKPSGSVPVVSGRLQLDALDLTRSSARLELDLTQLQLDADSLPADAERGGASPAEQALRWLELGAEVPEQRRRQYGRAVFELSAVEGQPEPLELTAFERSARLTAVGGLLLHGFRAPLRVRVAVQPQRTEGGPPRLSIRSLEPAVVSLVAHDVVARNAAGVAEPTVSERAFQAIGKSARVEFELVAEQRDH